MHLILCSALWRLLVLAKTNICECCSAAFSVCSSLALYLVLWFKWSSLVSQLSIDRRFPSVILHLVILAAKKEKSPLIVHYSSLHPLSVSEVNESPASRCSQMRRQSHKDRRKAGVGGKYIVKWHRLRTKWSWRPDRHFVFQGEPGFIGCCICDSQPCRHSNFIKESNVPELLCGCNLIIRWCIKDYKKQ